MEAKNDALRSKGLAPETKVVRQVIYSISFYFISAWMDGEKIIVMMKIANLLLLIWFVLHHAKDDFVFCCLAVRETYMTCNY